MGQDAVERWAFGPGRASVAGCAPRACCAHRPATASCRSRCSRRHRPVAVSGRCAGRGRGSWRAAVSACRWWAGRRGSVGRAGPGSAARLVARAQRPPERGGHRAGAAPEVRRPALGVVAQAQDAGVAGQPAGGPAPGVRCVPGRLRRLTMPGDQRLVATRPVLGQHRGALGRRRGVHVNDDRLALAAGERTACLPGSASIEVACGSPGGRHRRWGLPLRTSDADLGREPQARPSRQFPARREPSSRHAIGGRRRGPGVGPRAGPGADAVQR